jgi:hypothetical protein
MPSSMRKYWINAFCDHIQQDGEAQEYIGTRSGSDVRNCSSESLNVILNGSFGIFAHLPATS